MGSQNLSKPLTAASPPTPSHSRFLGTPWVPLWVPFLGAMIHHPFSAKDQHFAGGLGPLVWRSIQHLLGFADLAV